MIAQFMQEDTYRGDGRNLYAYCRNNPVYYVDPSRHICDPAARKIMEKLGNHQATRNEQKKLAAYLRNKDRHGGLTYTERGALQQVDSYTYLPRYENQTLPWKNNKGESKSGSNTKVHGNSKLSTKSQHGYEIYNRETGDVVKTGISGQKLNLNSTSPKANSQVNKLNKSIGRQLYDSRIVATDMPNRLSALEWERENALRLWNEGNSMPLHKRPRPWEE